MSKIEPVIEFVLYLVRHGESEGNLPRNNDTLTTKELHDPCLTQKGVSQAKAAGEYLKDTHFDAVYSSALRRAVQTAREIIKNNSGKHTLQILPLITEAGIPENYVTDMDTVCEIVPNSVLATDYPNSLPLLCYNSSDDNKGLFERAEKLFEYLRSHYSNGEQIALVSHAAFITFICFVAMGINEEVPVFDLNFKNTGITKIIFYKKGTNPYGDVVFDYINSTTHLSVFK